MAQAGIRHLADLPDLSVVEPGSRLLLELADGRRVFATVAAVDPAGVITASAVDISDENDRT